MIQFDDGKCWNLPSRTGEELQSQTALRDGDVSGSNGATVLSEASECEDVVVYVSPSPAPFPRVFPGL